MVTTSVCLALLLCGFGNFASAGIQPAPSRIVALGDLHGDYGRARLILEAAEVIDSDGQWIANDTTLVQTGDIADRGPDGPAIFELFMRMRSQAPEGAVVNLLGNHEGFLLCGVADYVSAEEVQRYYNSDTNLLRLAWAPDGNIGRFIRSHFQVYEIFGSAVFVHAGLLPQFASHSPDELKTALLKNIDGERCRRGGASSAVLGNEGPFWTRLWTEQPPKKACAVLRRSLDLLGVEVMVVGHTPTPTGRFTVSCGGALVTIDTAISRWMGSGSAASFLTIEPDGRWFESLVQEKGDRPPVVHRRRLKLKDRDEL